MASRFFCSAATAVAVSTKFDRKCSRHIARKLKGSNVRLENSVKFGNGLFATSPFQKGQIVLSEIPLLAVPSPTKRLKKATAVAMAAPPEWQEDFELVAQAVATIVNSSPGGNLPKSNFANSLIPLRCLSWTHADDAQTTTVVSQVLFDALTTTFGLSSCKAWNRQECTLLYDKVKSNCFFSAMGPAVFEAISMLNHSCEPNVEFHRFNHNNVVAVRDIDEGEQIFIHYMVPPHDLPELYGFQCTCARCTRQ